MIEVSQVSKRFRDVMAVSDLSFSAPCGAITGLLGANGAGKTTTLRMIAGVLKPDAGAIRVGAAAADGDARPNARVAAARLGALLDHTGLYPRLTARENLRYFARLRGLTGAALETHVERVLQQLDLTEIADRRTAGFSQGQRMKVALGRALIHEPTHLLLDEPTSGLDVQTVRKLRGLLADLRDAGTCVLFSSHVLTEVESLCDRIVVMAGGDVVGQGTCDELCRGAATTSLEEAFLTLTGEYGEATC
jgi:sodium transport system ATP-binding protein